MIASPICVALDGRDVATLRHIAEATASSVGAFKVGLTSFISLGRSFVDELRDNGDVFLDLKLHDIPAQVAGAVATVTDLGVRYTTVHALGGASMIEAAAGSAGENLAVLAVTVLTSHDDKDLRALGLEGSPADAVLRLADLALRAGAHGLVCSPLEVAAIRSRFGARSDGGPILVVPGIRSPRDDAGDQRRTMAADEAHRAGADLLVIGRPITSAPDPGAAARSLLEELSRA